MAKLSRIAPELPVADLTAAMRHYEQRLGFKVATSLDGYAIVERDGAAIHLFENRARNHTPVGIHIFTGDLEELYIEFQQSGAFLTQGIERKPWGNREFRLHDDSGNEIKFTEPI